MSQKKTAAKREIVIVARYFILKNHGKYQVGDVVLLVKNDKGVEYLVTIRPDGDHACSCPATKKCYHLTACIAIESAREAAAERVLAAMELAQEVEQIVLEAEKEQIREAVPARDLAPLGGNRPFSLLRQEKVAA
jgi:hypothetical protein